MLPPKRPEPNGAVERTQGPWCYESCACHDLPFHIDNLQRHVDDFAHRYNRFRLHDALDGQTPAEYLKALSAASPQSHMGWTRTNACAGAVNSLTTGPKCTGLNPIRARATQPSRGGLRIQVKTPGRDGGIVSLGSVDE